MTQRRTPPPSGRARPGSATTRTPAAPRAAHRVDTEGDRRQGRDGQHGIRHRPDRAGHRSLRRRPPERGAALRRPPRGHRPAGTRPTNARSAPARRPTNPTRGRTGGSGGGSGRRSTAVRGGTPAGNPRRRMRFLTVACLFVLSVFGAQLVRIQGFDATAVAQEAQLKREAAQIIPAMRGQVLASDGTVLASSVVREVVVADQTGGLHLRHPEEHVRPRHLRGGRAEGGDRARPAAQHHGLRAGARAHRHQPLPHPQPRGHAADVEHHLRAWGSPASTATAARPAPSAPTRRAARRPPWSAT